MDNNISRRRSSVDASSTATSVYLSFDDNESTNMGSTTCYRTLEVMDDDVSIRSSLSTIADASDEKHLNNSTLENHDDSAMPSPVKTVKKMEIMTSNTPLRVLPKNILREYKALCSTPSKEQLLKTVDVTRGSEVKRFDDLGVAFLGVDDEMPAFFPPPPSQHKQQIRNDENKENMSDGSTLSVSSSVEITTSVIEKKCVYSISTIGMHATDSGEEEHGECIVVEDIEKTPKGEKNFLPNVDGANDLIEETNQEGVIVIEDDIIITHQTDVPFQKSHEIDSVQCSSDDKADKTAKTECESNSKIATITEDDETADISTPKLFQKKEIIKAQTATKPKIPVLKPAGRRSVCEPNLKTNKPSRILAAGPKRQSLLPVTKNASTPMDVEKEIPMLMDRMLKISNTSMKEDEGDKPEVNKFVDGKLTTIQPMIKRRSVNPSTSKGRSSLMPTALAEKRPYRFAPRMSVVVKTTLNSPARKMARKNSMGINGVSAQQQQRRSIMASRLSQATGTGTKMETTVRRSMLTTSKLAFGSSSKNTLVNVKETMTQRKSMYPNLSKVSEESKIRPPTLSANSNQAAKMQDITFTCSSCKEKFRIKSLLDAHRRSHEGETTSNTIAKNKALPTAQTVKMPQPTGPSTKTTHSMPHSEENKCKYCDKKFALVRALHIHLLQNCSKIPPGDKRKLQYTEMNHVEKAKLPTFAHHGNGSANTASSKQATPRMAVRQQKSVDIGKYNKESSMEKDLRTKQCDSSSSSISGSQTNIAASTATNTTGSVQKSKKATAHSGVFKTPSKSVPCHLCKLTFKSILDYTNHSLATHSYKTPKDEHQTTGGNDIK
ncbi:serine-rich adhesin for platelets [Stomoxys calcitrans]|uniref:serine-rich adhesin for platelets n=1 Tax=Stomoxys calcitrans TaxID=35570 RepID=UPI0027E33920|nr:serine-rich adhesin for platelets [Stomoxys calcitrans]